MRPAYGPTTWIGAAHALSRSASVRNPARTGANVQAQRPPGGERLTHNVGVQTFHNRKSQSLWAVRCSVVLGRSFRNKSSKDMAFPHPKSRKDNCRKEDKPNSGGVVWNFFKRTINITEYRNAKDNVNTAKNRTFGGVIHNWFVNLNT